MKGRPASHYGLDRGAARAFDEAGLHSIAAEQHCAATGRGHGCP
jgi:hypothetical protein